MLIIHKQHVITIITTNSYTPFNMSSLICIPFTFISLFIILNMYQSFITFQSSSFILHIIIIISLFTILLQHTDQYIRFVNHSFILQTSISFLHALTHLTSIITSSYYTITITLSYSYNPFLLSFLTTYLHHITFSIIYELSYLVFIL